MKISQLVSNMKLGEQLKFVFLEYKFQLFALTIFVLVVPFMFEIQERVTNGKNNAANPPIRT
jgi:hypothetical protein